MPDDETVNQMIARHEEEFDLFMVSAADWMGQFRHPTLLPSGAKQTS